MIPISPRRRKIRKTVRLLTAFVTVSVTIAILIYIRRQPVQYRPDEKNDDITSGLARNIPPEAPKPHFTNVTASAGLSDFRNFKGQRSSQLPEDMGPGLAWGDFNNDGLEDLFLVSAGGSLATPNEELLPCALFENIGNGKFRRVESFPKTCIHGMAAAWGDYDGDGFLDLVVTGYNTLFLFHNEGGCGKFTRDSRLPNPQGFWSSAAWGDFNNDRLLDLYVCGYVQYKENPTLTGVVAEDQSRGSVPFTLNPASYLGGTNLLFRGDADGTFTEVGGELGVQNSAGRSLGALWHDFDEDGWLDLYVANDISDNVFYHNVGGKFEDISHPALVADYRSAMGLTAGDFDRDGDDDLYITHWVAQENALYENLWSDFNGDRRPANAGRPLSFMDIADRKGLGQISLPYVGWGAEFADFDCDGWLDLVCANGNTLEFDGPMPRKLKPQESFLFWNRRGEFFHNIAPLSPVLSEVHNSRGLAVADFDNDGKLDMAVADLGEGVRLLRNQMQCGNFLKVRLRSRNRAGQPIGFGDGSTAIAKVGEAILRRSVFSVSYLSQSSRTLHFGLGDAAKIDDLEVRWHAGAVERYSGLVANTMYEISEGDPVPRRIQSAPAIQAYIPKTAGNQRVIEFWKIQRAAMNAMKVDRDPAKAIPLFRQALAINPAHEDSLYYLALSFAETRNTTGALAQLAELRRINPSSHRAWQQWGIIQALSARSNEELRAAQASLERANALNPEETGALLSLGEVLLMQGDRRGAEKQLSAACATNPKASSGLFMRAYIAWKNGDTPASTNLLECARATLGPDWKPKGSTSEGDVQRKQHIDATPLARFFESWDGLPDPGRAFGPIDGFLATH